MARNFPHHVLYGPQKFNGAGFKHPFFNSGIEKISTIIQECTQFTQTGNLIQAVSEGFRMELGYNRTLGVIKEKEYKIIKNFVSPCWYEHVLKFFVAVNDISERIELIEDTTLLPELRRNDEFLMEEFIAAGVSRDHLKIINYIRMHLKAIMLADITTPNGARTSFDAYNVIGSNNLRVDYDWPRSPPSFTQRQKET